MLEDRNILDEEQEESNTAAEQVDQFESEFLVSAAISERKKSQSRNKRSEIRTSTTRPPLARERDKEHLDIYAAPADP